MRISRFHRALLPALFTLLALGLAPAARATSTARTTLPGVPDSMEQKVLTLVNRARANHGLSPLKMTSCPDSHAELWSQHMAAIQTMVHSSLDPLLACKDARAAGQNIAYGQATAREVFRAWMHSPTHRANILSKKFHRTGIAGVKSVTGVVYWTQDFVG